MAVDFEIKASRVALESSMPTAAGDCVEVLSRVVVSTELDPDGLEKAMQLVVEARLETDPSNMFENPNF